MSRVINTQVPDTFATPFYRNLTPCRKSTLRKGKGISCLGHPPGSMVDYDAIKTPVAVIPTCY